MAPNNNGNQIKKILIELGKIEGEILIISPSIKGVINSLQEIASSIDGGDFLTDTNDLMLLLNEEGRELSLILTKIIDNINAIQRKIISHQAI